MLLGVQEIMIELLRLIIHQSLCYSMLLGVQEIISNFSSILILTQLMKN